MPIHIVHSPTPLPHPTDTEAAMAGAAVDPRARLADPTALVGIPQLHLPIAPVPVAMATDPRAVPMAPPAQGGQYTNLDAHELAAIIATAQAQQQQQQQQPGNAGEGHAAEGNQDDLGGQLLS